MELNDWECFECVLGGRNSPQICGVCNLEMYNCNHRTGAGSHDHVVEKWNGLELSFVDRLEEFLPLKFLFELE